MTKSALRWAVPLGAVLALAMGATAPAEEYTYTEILLTINPIAEISPNGTIVTVHGTCDVNNETYVGFDQPYVPLDIRVHQDSLGRSGRDFAFVPCGEPAPCPETCTNWYSEGPSDWKDPIQADTRPFKGKKAVVSVCTGNEFRLISSVGSQEKTCVDQKVTLVPAPAPNP